MASDQKGEQQQEQHSETCLTNKPRALWEKFPVGAAELTPPNLQYMWMFVYYVYICLDGYMSICMYMHIRIYL